MQDFRASIFTRINSTEDPSKVESAVVNLFPDARLTVLKDGINGDPGDFSHLKDELKRLKMRDSARAHFKSCEIPGGIFFSLSKQAAFMKRVSLSTGIESPLGDIEIQSKTDDVSMFIELMVGGEES